MSGHWKEAGEWRMTVWSGESAAVYVRVTNGILNVLKAPQGYAIITFRRPDSMRLRGSCQAAQVSALVQTECSGEDVEAA